MIEQAKGLRALLTQRPGPGRIVWLGVRAQRTLPMKSIPHADLQADHGMQGDYASARKGSKRQVSLIQSEHLPVIAALCALPLVTPEQLRRNIVVSGINLLALRGRKFRLGNAVLEGVGACEPCSKMERALGVGGYNAMRGHGGILARVLEGADIRVGDAVDFHEPA